MYGRPVKHGPTTQHAPDCCSQPGLYMRMEDSKAKQVGSLRQQAHTCLRKSWFV